MSKFFKLWNTDKRPMNANELAQYRRPIHEAERIATAFGGGWNDPECWLPSDRIVISTISPHICHGLDANA